MFNTSTLITLGLTALLCGIIMFYCKRKFAEYEQKLDVMSDLISNIITQLNQIPPSVYDNSSFVPPGLNQEYPPANIAMNVMPQVEEDDERDSDDESENNGGEDKRIIVNLGNNYENETNTITLNQESLEDDAWDSEESDDGDENENDETNENNNKISIQEHDLNVLVESETLNNETTTAQNIAEEMVGKIVEEVSDSDEVKVIDTNAPVEVDYSKLQVAMLKKMVSERKLAQGVSKMKKQELIDLLMNKSQ